MENNVYYNCWVESILKMDEQELWNAIHNATGCDQEYIQLVKDRLKTDFHHNDEELNDAMTMKDVDYQNAMIKDETDKPLSSLSKALVILGWFILPLFAGCFVVYANLRKVKNSLGEKRHLYDEASRK